MIKQTAIAMGLVMAAGTVGAAQASTDGGTANVAFGPSFKTLDSNGNGQISWSEANAHGISETAFESAETTQDGALSMAEYNAAVAARGGVVGEAVEVGKDAGAQEESMSGGMESSAMSNSMQSNAMSGSYADMNASTAAYAAMDANNDGRVSQDEFKLYTENADVYAHWDVNGDGMIDQQEFIDVLYVFYDDNGDGYIDDAEWEDGMMVDDYGDNGFWDM